MHAYELIRKARREAGQTQVSLAARLGLPQSAVARLERPGSNPTWRTVTQVLRATGHDLDLRRVQRKPVPLDLDQIRGHVDLTPAERLSTFDHNNREIADLAARAVRVSRD